jgi:hypothetical protein
MRNAVSSDSADMPLVQREAGPRVARDDNVFMARWEKEFVSVSLDSEDLRTWGAALRGSG